MCVRGNVSTVNPSAHAAAPLASLPVPTGCWESMSMDFVFGLPKDSEDNTGIVVFVDRLSKMSHLASVPDSIDAQGTAKLFIDRLFRQNGLPVVIVSDRDPRFTGKFWKSIFTVLGTLMDMSTADHPQTDGKLSVSIASLMTFCEVFVLILLCVGAPCSLSLNLR